MSVLWLLPAWIYWVPDNSVSLWVAALWVILPFNPLVGYVFPPHISWSFHPYPGYNLEDLHYFSSPGLVLKWNFWNDAAHHAHCLNIPSCILALIYQNVLLCLGPRFGLDEHCSSSDVTLAYLAFPWDLMFLSLWLDFWKLSLLWVLSMQCGWC